MLRIKTKEEMIETAKNYPLHWNDEGMMDWLYGVPLDSLTILDSSTHERYGFHRIIRDIYEDNRFWYLHDSWVIDDNTDVIKF